MKKYLTVQNTAFVLSVVNVVLSIIDHNWAAATGWALVCLNMLNPFPTKLFGE